MMKRLIFITIVVCIFVSTTALADMTTDEAAFTAMLQPGYYLNEFSGYNWNVLNSPQNFGPVNGWQYSVSTSTGRLWGLPTYGGCLSTEYPDAVMTITPTGSRQVMAIGGRFFGSDWDGNQQNATIHIVLSDGTIEEFSNTSYSDFRGFTSSVPIAYLSISIPGMPHDVNWRGPYPTIDHLYVGEVVPVPGAVLLGLLGLSAAGIKLRKFA